MNNYRQWIFQGEEMSQSLPMRREEYDVTSSDRNDIHDLLHAISSFQTNMMLWMIIRHISLGMD